MDKPIRHGPAKVKSGESGLPTGHLNSSQVACVNHLEPARLDRVLARQVAQNAAALLLDVAPVEDGGFVAYEWIGDANYLKEPGARVRGANVTSLDALLVGVRSDDGQRLLVAFEWKYLERYGLESRAKSKRGTDRVAIYQRLLDDPACPIKPGDAKQLFYDPFEQLMRQTLFAWQMVVHGEFGTSDWLHVQVVPELNVALRHSNAAPDLPGTTMYDKWRSVLHKPDGYRVMTATDLLAGVPTSEWRRWLHERYLT